MHAVIVTGGKQYKVAEGQRIKIEKLPNAVGEQVAFDQVLMVRASDENIQIGSPYIAGARVNAEVVGQGRGKKVHIIKMRRRKHYMRKQGHRQDFTEVQIQEIAGNI